MRLTRRLSVPVCFSVVVTDQKQWGGGVIWGYHHLSTRQSQHKHSRQGPETATEEHGLLLCFPPLAHYLSYRSQAHLPKDGTANSGLGPPSSITNRHAHGPI